MKTVNEQIRSIEALLEESHETYQSELARLPNFLDPTAAIGPDESGNVVESTVGVPREFDFPVKPHYEIGLARGWIDSEK